jgi:hypothetical protein
MQDLVALPTALAFGAATMMLFAVIRRIVRTDHPPAFLASDAAAYALALVLTALIALSLMLTAAVIAPYLGSVIYAALSSAGLHIAYWSIARLIIPVRAMPGDTTLLPPAAPAA